MSIPIPWILIVLAALFMLARCDMNQAVERSRNVHPSKLPHAPGLPGIPDLPHMPTSPFHWPLAIHLVNPTGNPT